MAKTIIAVLIVILVIRTAWFISWLNKKKKRKSYVRGEFGNQAGKALKFAGFP